MPRVTGVEFLDSESLAREHGQYDNDAAFGFFVDRDNRIK